MSRPSRTHTAKRRQQAAQAEELPVAWAAVRDMFPAKVRAKVDDLAERGGVTLRDLSAMTTAQLLVDLADQKAGAESGRQVAAGLRLLFRLAVATGGSADGSAALVQVPKELINVEIDDDDTGDDVMG